MYAIYYYENKLLNIPKLSSLWSPKLFSSHLILHLALDFPGKCNKKRERERDRKRGEHNLCWMDDHKKEKRRKSDFKMFIAHFPSNIIFAAKHVFET